MNNTIKNLIKFAEENGLEINGVQFAPKATKKAQAAERTPNSLKVEPIEQDGEVVGVVVPVINKSIIFAEIKNEMKWEQSMDYAKGLGKEMPTLKELYILAYYRDEIAAFLPEFADLTIWSSTEYSAHNAWYLHYHGSTYVSYKYDVCSVVPLADQ